MSNPGPRCFAGAVRRRRPHGPELHSAGCAEIGSRTAQDVTLYSRQYWQYVIGAVPEQCMNINPGLAPGDLVQMGPEDGRNRKDL